MGIDNSRGHDGRQIPEFVPGDQVGEWVVQRLISTGGYGQVYRVRDRADQDFALKVARADWDSGVGLRNEADIIRAYGEHPGLPKLYHAWEDHHRSFLVMEYLHGECLDGLLRRLRRPLSEERLTVALGQMLELLLFLHNRLRPILHLDIKTTQYLVNTDWELYMLDFGLAREANRDGTVYLSLGCGTPGYSAPEQYVARETIVDARADIYAVGAACYRLFSGQHPPKHGRILWTDCPGWGQLEHSWSRRLRQALSRSTAPDRIDRFQSVKEMMDYLYKGGK